MLGFVDEPLADRGIEDVAKDEGNGNPVFLRKSPYDAFCTLKVAETSDDRYGARLGNGLRNRDAKASRASGQDNNLTFYGVPPM